MVTARAPVSREDGLLTQPSLIRTILVVEHDPDEGKSFTQLLPCKPHQYVKLLTNVAAALNFVKHMVLPLSVVDNSESPANSFRAGSTLIRLLRQAVASCKPTCSLAFIFTKPPTAISRGFFSLHSRSQFEAWHYR